MEKMGIECDLESLVEPYYKLVCDSEEEAKTLRDDPEHPHLVDFELFARIVAIVLEMNNRLDEQF